jgi:hypothetical protein
MSDTQNKEWTELLEHKLFERSEKEYAFPFLNIVNDKGIEGLNKVIEVYSSRNSMIWKRRKLQILLKISLGSLIDKIESLESTSQLSIGEFILRFLKPEGKNKEILEKFVLPFDPEKHCRLMAKNFEDEEVMNLNEIPDIPPPINNNEGL